MRANLDRLRRQCMSLNEAALAADELEAARVVTEGTRNHRHIYIGADELAAHEQQCWDCRRLAAYDRVVSP